jgi:hypothetical protein
MLDGRFFDKLEHLGMSNPCQALAGTGDDLQLTYYLDLLS